MFKRTVIAVVLCLSLGLSAHASMVSFCIIETGVPMDTEERRQSLFWENAFMDVFFDSGYIVSNAPILRLDNKPTGDLIREFDISEIRRGGIDFMIIAKLDYNDDLTLSDVSFFIYKINPENKIYERKIERMPSRNERDEYAYMKSIAKGLIVYVD